MKCGLIGGSSQQRSLPFDAQRSINLFPVLDDQGKDVASLYSAPGRKLLATAGNGPGRGSFAASNGRAFHVSGNILYEHLSDNTVVSRGTLDQSQSLVTMDENGFQLAICDGAILYIFTYLTNSFLKVVTANLPSAGTVTFLGGYFIVSRPKSGIFQISKLYDGTTWAALDFATAESSPDDLLCVKNINGQLALVGVKSTEFWQATGGAKFPFSRVNGATLSTGTLSAYSVLSLDNSMFFISRDDNGAGIGFRLEGFSPRRITTNAIELLLQAAPNPETFRSFSYQEEGHTFWVVTGGGMSTALAYDLSTQEWHERAYLNDYGVYEQDRAATAIYAFNKIITIDRSNGNIYEQNLKYNSDNGDELVRDRIFTHLFDENQRFQIKNLTVGFETGLGSTTGSDPKMTLSLSRDGGKTWFSTMMKRLGLAGQYLRRVTFWRLGQARIMTFRVRVTDDVPVRITGGYFNTK